MEHHKQNGLNPDDFVIKRRRKKYRFAQFYNAENCFELEDWQAFQGRSLENGQELTVEIGAGTGLFSVELARRYPRQVIVALDVKADRLQKGARVALQDGLKNVFFVRARADQLLDVVKPHTVTNIWLTFSDPFPKKRDAKRRLTHPKFLEIYKNIHVSDKAQLLMKTDNHVLFDWSLEQLVMTGWHIHQLSYDLHESTLPDDYKIMTTYEQKWIKQGLPIYFMEACRK